MNIRHHINRTLQNRRAQLLLPAVLLLPLFMWVLYLLFETAKVSLDKVDHQFALDNAAYTQMTSVSGFLNAVAQTNGPLPSRALKTYDDELKPVNMDNLYHGKANWTVFDLFFQAGAVPSIGPDYDKNARRNPDPKPESNDWEFHYAKYEGIDEVKDDDGKPVYDRSEWEKETPAEIDPKKPVVLMNKEMVDKHYVAAKKVGLPAIMAYLNTYVKVGDIFNLQKDLYQKQIRNAEVFRKGYYLNVDSCKESECARQSASRLIQFLSIPTKRQETEKVMVYVSASDMAGGTGGAVKVPLEMKEVGAEPLFLFAYVDATGRSRLKTLKRGVTLKQTFPLKRNNFNIDLVSKYKPYVRTTISLTCPRANNNCVWPNPISKYSTVLRP